MPQTHNGRMATGIIPALVAAFALVGSCGGKKQPSKLDEANVVAAQRRYDAANVPDASGEKCEPLPFAASIALAEASGAVLVPGVGLLVAADSGRLGAYEIVDPATGEVIERGSFPLSAKVSDDVEGLTSFAEGGRVVVIALTSSGTVFELERGEKSFRQRRPPYRLGKEQPGCSQRSSNCGSNWEGICLGDIAVGELAGCAGAAVSKRDGALVCLVTDDDGRLALDRERSLEVGREETLSGCTIDKTGAVWVATNILGANVITRVGREKSTTYASWAAGSIEAIAVLESLADGAVELALFSDTAAAPSASFRYRCGDGL